MSTQELLILAKLLDEIIPENKQKAVPAGGTPDVRDYVASALKNSGDDWAILTEKLRAFGINENNCIAFLEEIEASAPALFQRIKRFAYIGYYGRAETRPYFGLSAEPTQPRGYDVPQEPPEFLAELTASVVSRGTCYRIIPEESRPDEK